jgi:predicted dehydrogenase
MDRRGFLKSSGGAMAALTAAQYSRVKGANERVNVACVGVRGRGKNHIEYFAKNPGSVVATVVDIDQAVGEQAVQHAMKFQSEKPKEAKDLRVMLEDKTIDAVSIATPNHWHALATIWACQAGKDVYCEKPASHNIFEGRKMVEAARKYNRIVQIGHQSRTNAHKIRAMELLREGVIGEVYMARGLCFKRRKPIGHNEATDIPAGVDYEMWLGPAEERAFKENRFHYNWHWYWDFGNGDIGNQGVHEMDIARWGLGKTDLPRFVYSSGGHFISNDDQQTPNTQQAIFDYDDSQIVFEVRGLLTGGEADMQPDLPRDNNTIGNTFLGSEGFMTVNAAGFHTYLGEKHEPGPSMKYQEDGQYATAPHVDNFLAAVKSRNHRDLTCDVLEGHLSAALCHLANTSYRVQRRLEFDPRTETFVGDSEADKYLSRRYRPGFEVPEKV